MTVLISETQYKSIISEFYDRNRPYVRKEVFDAMKRAPGHLKSYLKGLPRFYIKDEQGVPHMDQNGEKIVFTKIPEIIYDYLRGAY